MYFACKERDNFSKGDVILNFAGEIKEMVSTPDLFAFYGFKRNSKGFVSCPFHHEKTASMRVYDGDKGYHCFGCGAHGNDVINFVQQYFDISFSDAVVKINQDFNLGLPIGKEMNDREREYFEKRHEIAMKKRETEQEFRDRLDSAYDKAISEWIKLDQQRMSYAPKSPSDSLHPLFVESLKRIDYVSHVIDVIEGMRYKIEHG